jgi:hypothetical protein
MTAEAQVADLLGAVEARPPGAYAWFGHRFQARSLPARLERDFLATGEPRPPGERDVAAAGDGGALMDALSQANSGRGAWQPGWQAAATGGGELVVVRPDGLALRAAAEDCRGDGAALEVRLPKELRGVSPGRYVALGDTPGPAPAGRVRLSWNLAAAGATALVARVTYVLNGAGLPFWLELPANAAGYGRRRDAAALLLARADFADAMAVLRPLLRALGPHLSDGAPALSKPLTRGLAVAEEPDGPSSFAEHRCALLAGAILAAPPGAGPAARLALVREHFAAAGVDLARPYLQPGSQDVYARP